MAMKAAVTSAGATWISADIAIPPTLSPEMALARDVAVDDPTRFFDPRFARRCERFRPSRQPRLGAIRPIGKPFYGVVSCMVIDAAREVLGSPDLYRVALPGAAGAP